MALDPVHGPSLLVSAIVLLYYDRHVRTEALDVKIVAERLEPAPA